MSFRDRNLQILVRNIPKVSVTVGVTVTGEKHDACSYKSKLTL